MREKIQFLKKPGCHLCDDAGQVLDIVCQRLGLYYETVDISAISGYEEFAEDIPVLLIEGRKVLKHRFAMKDLERVLSRGRR